MMLVAKALARAGVGDVVEVEQDAQVAGAGGCPAGLDPRQGAGAMPASAATSPSFAL